MKETQKNRALSIVKWIIFAMGVIGTAVAIYFDSRLFGEASVFNKTISKNGVLNVAYQKIPAIIRSLQIIVIAAVIILLVKLIIGKCFAMSNRSITIGKLIESFMRWVVVIAAILFVLSSWGVDASALLASAGILTLVIGLGAQSLVADIVAGIFIVFESEFQVGDIVIINDWRGTVKEIGIRTTKIVDAGGNINIVNNSEITTIINQTKDVSLAKCIIGIEYGESLPRVELVVQENLKRIKESIPAIIDGPYYKGVTALNTSSVDLLFIAQCKEEDIYQVQRDLNREFKLLFDEHNINIPFPQVVINEREKTLLASSVSERKKAKKFVESQRELSKGMEEEQES